MAPSETELAKNIQKNSVAKVRQEQGIQSEFLYATYLGKGSSPGLVDVEILGETFTDIPRMVGAWGWHTIDHDIVTDHSSTLNFDIPSYAIEVKISGAGRLAVGSGIAFVAMSVNDDNNTNYRWGRIAFGSDGVIESSFHDNADNDVKVGRWNSSLNSNNFEVTIFPDPISYTARSTSISSTDSSHMHSLFGGRYNVGGSLSSVQIYGDDTFRDLSYKVEILVAPIAGTTQLMCIRSKTMPLTVMGMILGETI